MNPLLMMIKPQWGDLRRPWRGRRSDHNALSARICPKLQIKSYFRVQVSHLSRFEWGVVTVIGPQDAAHGHRIYPHRLFEIGVLGFRAGISHVTSRACQWSAGRQDQGNIAHMYATTAIRAEDTNGQIRDIRTAGRARTAIQHRTAQRGDTGIKGDDRLHRSPFKIDLLDQQRRAWILHPYPRHIIVDLVIINIDLLQVIDADIILKGVGDKGIVADSSGIVGILLAVAVSVTSAFLSERDPVSAKTGWDRKASPRQTGSGIQTGNHDVKAGLVGRHHKATMGRCVGWANRALDRQMDPPFLLYGLRGRQWMRRRQIHSRIRNSDCQVAGGVLIYPSRRRRRPCRVVIEVRSRKGWIDIVKRYIGGKGIRR